MNAVIMGIVLPRIVVAVVLTVWAADRACAQTATDSADTRVAIKALEAFATVCDQGKSLWGTSLCGPMVIVDGATHDAVANRPDPDGIFKKHGDVYLGHFPDRFTISNTSITWGNQEWATVRGPLPADPYARLSLLVHESFHRIQKPAGLGGSDQPNPHLDTEAGRLWLRMELRALARALRSEGAAARVSTQDALLFRARRYQLCPGAEQAEAEMEKQEGLAEYTGVAVALKYSGEDISRTALAVEDYDAATAYARSFAYATGPALGLLLDRYAPQWRQQVRSRSMYRLLASAVNFNAGDAKDVGIQHASKYGYRAVAAAEQERDLRQKEFLADLQHRFVEGPVLLFPRGPELYRSFNPNALVPFGTQGTFYPTGTFTSAWGKLQVDSVGAVVSPDNMAVRVAAPADINTRPLRGPGWTLELAPGWIIRPSGSSGSYEVASAAESK